MKTITIGVTDCEKFINYHRWMEEIQGVRVIKLGCKEKNLKEISLCQGIVMTGGEDVHPQFYNKPEYLEYCHQDDINTPRDEFELEVISQSQHQGIPLLGICRGLQIANVYFGGTLIPDLPIFKKTEHSKFFEGNDRYHHIKVLPHTVMHQMTGNVEGVVNSAHHQSADKIGEGLVVNCLSDDTIVEGLERTDSTGKSYLMLVQWHPERMKDQQNLFASKVRENFLLNINNMIHKIH